MNPYPKGNAIYRNRRQAYDDGYEAGKKEALQTYTIAPSTLGGGEASRVTAYGNPRILFTVTFEGDGSYVRAKEYMEHMEARDADQD